MLLAVPGLGTLASPVRAQDPFQIRELSPGVYAALVRPDPPMYVFANALIVVGEGGIVVVDTHQSPSAARALLDRIAELSPRPVTHVVNTHWHGDHVYGNQSYQDAFPRVAFVGHRTTRQDVQTKAAEALAKEVAELPGSIEQRESWIAGGRGPNGEALTEEQMRALRRSARLRREYLAELRNLRLLPPTVTFERELTLYQGDRPIRLLHPGRAHTRGDVAVYLPRERILAVGDLVEDGLPWVDENSFPVGWAGVLERLSELDVDVIVPAHGPILTDRRLLDGQRDFFVEVARRVRDGVRRGFSLEAIQAEIDPAELPRFVDPGDERAEERFGAWVERVVARAYRELTTDSSR